MSQRGQAVLDTMADEGKLIDPTFKIDTDKGYGADYGYFIVNAVDVDTLSVFLFTTSGNIAKILNDWR